MSVQEAINVTVIKTFVREVLGCGCSDEVFRQIHLQRGSAAIKSYPADYEIAVGGRLLIAVVSGHEQVLLTQKLDRIVEEGKQARNAGGFNRFRLVVVSGSGGKTDDLENSLEQQFNKSSVRDEKTHLHVIAKGKLPDFFNFNEG